MTDAYNTFYASKSKPSEVNRITVVLDKVLTYYGHSLYKSV